MLKYTCYPKKDICIWRRIVNEVLSNEVDIDRIN